jgi:hypothetical protein
MDAVAGYDKLLIVAKQSLYVLSQHTLTAHSAVNAGRREEGREKEK